MRPKPPPPPSLSPGGMGRGDGAGGGGGCTYFVSVGRDVPPKGARFSESVWDGGIFHCTNSGKGLKYTCLERGPCLSEKGLLSYLCLE